MKTLQQSHTSIGWQFTAYSDDGSLEDATQQFITLLTALFAWVQLQLSIAGAAQELIIEARMVLQRAYIALGLVIEIMTIVLGWVRWVDRQVETVALGWQIGVERFGISAFKWGWNYGG